MGCPVVPRYPAQGWKSENFAHGGLEQPQLTFSLQQMRNHWGTRRNGKGVIRGGAENGKEGPQWKGAGRKLGFCLLPPPSCRAGDALGPEHRAIEKGAESIGGGRVKETDQSPLPSSLLNIGTKLLHPTSMYYGTLSHVALDLTQLAM